MDNTITALQALYVALGGALTDTYDSIANGIPVSDYVIIPDMINALANVASTAVSAELPKVTSTDNGKVLTVVSGKWAKASLPE